MALATTSPPQPLPPRPGHLAVNEDPTMQYISKLSQLRSENGYGIPEALNIPQPKLSKPKMVLEAERRMKKKIESSDESITQRPTLPVWNVDDSHQFDPRSELETVHPQRKSTIHPDQKATVRPYRRNTR